MNYNFEWDPTKAKKNLSKHKISFEDAASIFKDKNSISMFDESHSENEERWATIGLDARTRILVVIHTYISLDNDTYNIRMISARKATKNEIKFYNQG